LNVELELEELKELEELEDLEDLEGNKNIITKDIR
jgi:hypothetical protein